jgi:hypothetical protein
MLDGSLGVDSNLGMGTTVELRVPTTGSPSSLAKYLLSRRWMRRRC